jgi:pyruvate carboxylase
MREIRLVRGVEKETPDKKEEVFRGEIKQPKSFSEKLDEQMKKVELKTQKLIDKAENQKVKSAQIKNKSKQIDTHQEHIKSDQEQNLRKAKELTIIDYYCLRGLPKKILGYFQSSANFDEQLNQWIAVIDTEQLKILTGKTASHLSVQILRLEKQGWFQLIQSSNSGIRVIQINPQAFPINQ